MCGTNDLADTVLILFALGFSLFICPCFLLFGLILDIIFAIYEKKQKKLETNEDKNE